MIDWLLNPYNVSDTAYLALWLLIGASLIIGCVYGFTKAIRERRTRDGEEQR